MSAQSNGIGTPGRVQSAAEYEAQQTAKVDAAISSVSIAVTDSTFACEVGSDDNSVRVGVVRGFLFWSAYIGNRGTNSRTSFRTKSGVKKWLESRTSKRVMRAVWMNVEGNS